MQIPYLCDQNGHIYKEGHCLVCGGKLKKEPDKSEQQSEDFESFYDRVDKARKEVKNATGPVSLESAKVLLSLLESEEKSCENLESVIDIADSVGFDLASFLGTPFNCYTNFTEATHELPELVDTLKKTSLHQLWKEQSKFSQNTFGSDEKRGPVPSIKHLKKECDEVISDPSDEIEYADCLLLILDAARRAKISLPKLISLASEKLEINKNRKWNEVSGDDPAYHIEDDVDE